MDEEKIEEGCIGPCGPPLLAALLIIGTMLIIAYLFLTGWV